MRKEFAELLLEQMRRDSRIWLVTGDLGFGIWDEVRQSFPKRFINVGAAEQTLVGVGVGLATQGQIPVLYSITPFLLYRPFETIRNYLHHEQLPVKLVGSGRDKDYENEGFSHWAEEDKDVMNVLSGVKSVWPNSTKELPRIVKTMVTDSKPWYLNLARK
jgi:transketolase